MKKVVFILLACVLITAVNNKLYAQQITKFGDNVGTLDGIIKAYYDAVCVKKGEKVSYVRDSLLHIANVRVSAAAMSLRISSFVAPARSGRRRSIPALA